VGSDELRQERLAQVWELATPKEGREGIRQSALAKAEWIAQEKREVLGWAAEDRQAIRAPFFTCAARGNPPSLTTALQHHSSPMNTVTRDQIIEAWTRLCDLEETETDLLVKKFMDEQPALGIYLLANLEEVEGGAENTRIVELVVAAWLAMSKSAGRQLPAATPEEIERAEDANIRSLEELDEGSEFEWQNSVRDLVQGYNQREILGFGIEIMMSGNEDTPEWAPESIGLEMVCLKTVVDALDR
jgi:hypothetical protein